MVPIKPSPRWLRVTVAAELKCAVSHPQRNDAIPPQVAPVPGSPLTPGSNGPTSIATLGPALIKNAVAQDRLERKLVTDEARLRRPGRKQGYGLPCRTASQPSAIPRLKTIS